jgi:hypothetical protein
MSIERQAASEWGAFPFDAEIVLNAIPRGAKTASLHVSVSPVPESGGVRLTGRMAGGTTGSITLTGNAHAVELPFEDRVIRVQYLGDTRFVRLALESFTFA